MSKDLNIVTFIRNWKYLLSYKKNIGYIGWLGRDNIGDEALYRAIKKTFSTVNILEYKNTDKTKLVEKYIKRNLFSAILLGGGTLINGSDIKEMEIVQQKYRLSFVFGTGVRDPLFWNRINHKENRLARWIECLHKCKYVGVRGPLSKRILDNAGFTGSEIIGDPALLLANDHITIKKHNKLLGVNIGISKGNVWGNEEEILNNIVNILNILVDYGWELKLFPVWGDDIPYIEEARKRIKKPVSIYYNYKSIRGILRQIEKCDLFIGEKLHSVILAMSVYTPSIMLEYRPKCMDFMMSMGLEEFNVRTDSLDTDKIMSLINKLYNNSNYYQDYIYRKVNYFKQLQIERSMMISKWIQNE